MARSTIGASVALLVMTLMAQPDRANAVPFIFEYNDTVSSSGIAGVSAGQSAKVTVTLDNGNSTNLSQIWTANDAVSVEFDFNNGGLVTTFYSPWGGSLTAGFGNFVTDAAGNLTSVVIAWVDSTSADFTTTGSATSFNWFLTGFNSVYIQRGSSGPNFAVSFSNVDEVRNPAAWSQVSTSTVPEPATLALFGAGLAGLGLLARRRKAA